MKILNPKSIVSSRPFEIHPEIIRNRRGNASKFLNAKCPDCRTTLANIFWNQNYEGKSCQGCGHKWNKFHLRNKL